MLKKYSFKKISLVILFAIALGYGIDYAIKFFKHHFLIKQIYEIADISKQSVVECKDVGSDIWLMSYADGKPVYIANQNTLNASGINKCIDNFLLYRKKHIAPSYLEEHKHIFDNLRGAGYWLWKPYLILKTLEKIPENDILIYLDSGIIISRPITELLKHLDNHDILVSSLPEGFKQRLYTKRSALQKMNADNPEMHNKAQIQANIIFMRNNEFSRNFVKSWVRWAEMPEIIMDDPMDNNPYPDFNEHRHDQSILSILALQDKSSRIAIISEGETKEYMRVHRRLTQKHSLLPLYTKPEIAPYK